MLYLLKFWEFEDIEMIDAVPEGRFLTRRRPFFYRLAFLLTGMLPTLSVPTLSSFVCFLFIFLLIITL